MQIVKASDWNEFFVFNVKFEDKSGTLIDDYNPTHDPEVNEVSHTIGENEEIIGFYGADDCPENFKAFSRFGFIVKVRQ